MWDTEKRLVALFQFQIFPGQEMYVVEITRSVLKLNRFKCKASVTKIESCKFNVFEQDQSKSDLKSNGFVLFVGKFFPSVKIVEKTVIIRRVIFRDLN